jgi:hypothetical protein
MPREHRARAPDEPEMMNMDEPAVVEPGELPAKPEREAKQAKQPEEDEEYITLRASDLLHFQETLVDIRSQIADLQKDARQDRLEVQQMFRAIMDRLPPAAGPSAPPPTL